MTKKNLPADIAARQTLPPEALRALIKWKGWTHRELAVYWGISPVQVSRVISHKARPRYWDDAVAGLPRRPRLNTDLSARQTRIETLLTRGEASSAQANSRRLQKKTGGYRYHGYFVTGAIVTVSDDIGELLQAEDRGIVLVVDDTGSGERYGIVFETGVFEWFLPTHLDSHIVGTGLDAVGLSDYQYQGDIQVAIDYNLGHFRFW